MIGAMAQMVVNGHSRSYKEDDGMREWQGHGDLVGRVVGGYRLESLISESGASATFLATPVEGNLSGAAQSPQARVSVFRVPGTLAPEAQTEIRAQFQREVDAARQAAYQGFPSLLASGEDTFAGLLYLVTPATGAPSAAFAAPPPLPAYGWPAPPTSAPVFTPYSVAAETRRSSAMRVGLTMFIMGTVCVAILGVTVGCGALFFVLGAAINGPAPTQAYQAGSGCAVPGASVSAAAAPPAGALPDSKQVLRVQATGGADVQTLDPPDAYDFTSQQYASMVFPGLVTLDHNLCVIPWAARSLPTVSDDGTLYTFTLRPGLKWSDGTPITSQTFAYAINRAENPCSSFGAAYYLYDIQDAYDFNAESCDTLTNTIYGDIKTLIGDSLLTPDPLTLKIQLAYPATYFLSALAYPASYAVPEQLIQRYGNQYIDHLADGAGFGGNLFKVTAWDHKGALRLTRNDAFWGARPALREVDVRFYKDSGAAYNAYLAGKADVGSAPDALLAKARHHAGFHQIATQEIAYYAPNWKKAPFDDLGMRQAFAVALDKAALAATTLHGTMTPTNHITPEGIAGYNPGLNGPDGTQRLRGDTALANQLATTYATTSGCGTATDFSKCPPVTLTVASDPELVSQANAARRMWLKAMPKYPISIATMDFNTLVDYASGGDAQFWGYSWIGDYPDPQDWLSYNLSCGYNDTNACDNRADSLMLDADGNPNQAARLQEYQKAEQIMVTEVGLLPLAQAITWWEARSSVHNYTVSTTGLIPADVWQAIYLTAR
jgi:oligopeptide transport system substrate-binding protein